MCWGSILPLVHTLWYDLLLLYYHILPYTITKEDINGTKGTTEPQHLPIH